MKLRFPLCSQQLLSAAAGALLLGSGAMAQDVITLATGAAQQGKVLGMTASRQLEFQPAGTSNKLGYALANIREVRMAVPPEVGQAVTAYQAKEYAKSLTLLKPVVDRFKGLPTAWAQQATSLLGELYIQGNDLAKAEAAYADFSKFYPGSGSLQSDVGLSRLAVAKKDFETARQKLAPITDAALKEKIINPVNAPAYSQAFLVSGQVQEAEGKFAEALEDYLRTVTLFYHDRTAVASAQERADALRKDHAGLVAP